jgi:hypothetical protein
MKRLLAEIASTAVASLLLVLLLGLTVRTMMGPLAIQLSFAPGMMVAAKLFPSAYFGNGNGHMPNIGLGLILDFVFIWIELLLLFKVIETIVHRLKHNSAN